MLIFLDAETTGLEDEDRICSLGIIYTKDEELASQYELINDGKKVSPKASSVNHITNEMLDAKPILTNTEVYKFLKIHNNKDTTIVGHNIQYTMQKLLAVGYVFKGAIIDTLRVSKHLVKECESYSLQFLRYELKLYKNEKRELLAHHALDDAFVVRFLYKYLLEIATQDEMSSLSFKNVLIEKFEFGKYKARYIEEICMYDRNYLEWMLSNMDLDEDLRYSIDYYIQG
ncbi:MAG: exonuclease domain-containing protein [Sulfurimonas sp.]|nr:exonuclease domain-containing protein [Sulfurimonas sp.]